MARKTTTTTTVLRKLGVNERHQLAMCLLDQYRGTTLSCRYEIPARLATAEARPQLEEAVQVAVVDTVMRYPMLQVGLAGATSKTPAWAQLPSLDLAQHIQWLHLPQDAQPDFFEHTVQETIRAQLDDPGFPDVLSDDVRPPGWKITVVRPGEEDAPVAEVMLTWNHPQFDAKSAKVIHEDLLERLNALLADGGASHERAGLEGHVLRLPPTRPSLPLPIESLASLPVDLKYLARALWEERRPQSHNNRNRDGSWAAWCPIIRPGPTEPSYKTTQFRSFFVDNEALLAVQALCRWNLTTVTGLLNGLALLAFCARLDAAAAPAFQSATLVDHRRNLPPAAEPPGVPWGHRHRRAVGNYVTQCPHAWDAARAARVRAKLKLPAEGGDLPAELQRELWAAAAWNRLELVRKLEAGRRNDLVGLLNKQVMDWQQAVGNMAKKTRQFSWLVTNLGLLNVGGGGGGDTTKPDDGRWSIGRAQFGLSASVPAAAIAFSPVSVAGRGMCVSASWADGAFDGTLAESIMADLERWLAQLAESGPSCDDTKQVPVKNAWADSLLHNSYEWDPSTAAI